jgi:hypothetical protein
VDVSGWRAPRATSPLHANWLDNPDPHSIFLYEQGTYASVRLVFLAIGRELVRQGVMHQQDDVPFVRYHEVRTNGVNFTAFDVKEFVADRRRK